jgi:predicted nucleic acid-binding protein
MPALVLDSSVALTWFLPRQRTARTNALLIQTAEQGALTTSLWPIEIANVLLIYERRGQMTAAERSRALSEYSKLPIATDDQTAARAWSTAFELALAHKLTVYDAGYLELSLRTGLPLATLDQVLSKAATALGVPVLGFAGGTD